MLQIELLVVPRRLDDALVRKWRRIPAFVVLVLVPVLVERVLKTPLIGRPKVGLSGEVESTPSLYLTTNTTTTRGLSQVAPIWLVETIRVEAMPTLDLNPRP